MEREISMAADILRKSSHAIALTGAGISTPSGIPDFRSDGTGLWEKSDPMEVASFDSFMVHPEGFFDWLRPLAKLIMDAKPNPAHRALAVLEERGRVRAVITQNVDNLHQRAGSKRVFELHGNMRQATCVNCYRAYDGMALFEKLVANGEVPRCTVCSGVVKPDLVLFGEMLPMGIMYQAELETKGCDAMLVAGSSLEVSPACDLPWQVAQRKAALIIINIGKTPLDGRATVLIHDDVASVLPRIVERI